MKLLREHKPLLVKKDTKLQSLVNSIRFYLGVFAAMAKYTPMPIAIYNKSYHQTANFVMDKKHFPITIGQKNLSHLPIKIHQKQKNSALKEIKILCIQLTANVQMDSLHAITISVLQTMKSVHLIITIMKHITHKLYQRMVSYFKGTFIHLHLTQLLIINLSLNSLLHQMCLVGKMINSPNTYLENTILWTQSQLKDVVPMDLLQIFILVYKPNFLLSKFINTTQSQRK